jgi:HNH endonuclease
VEAAYPICGNEGCDSAHRLQMDHVHPVEHGGPAEKDNLWRLCGHDHRLKTLYGWQVDGSPGHWRLVPPDHDPDSGPDP